MTQISNYTESSIRILEGLEPVKLRPGQFTRTHNPLHIVQEVLDNGIDEAIAGHATEISVGLHPSGYVSIRDNGRGIPVGLHPEKKIPVVQAIFTVLYSGGKFDKASGGAYGYAGGLHGVGVSVTNALSESLVAEVIRDGWAWTIEFADGDVVKPLAKLGRREGSGTCVRMKPNPKYFDTAELPVKEFRELLRSKAVLLPGLRVTLLDERAGPAEPELFCYEAGMVAYLAELAGNEPLVAPLVGEGYASAEEGNFSEGEGASWAFSWYERADNSGKSFVNLIPTPEHGTHVAGLRSAIFNAVKAYAEHHQLLPKGLRLTADDAFKQVRFVLSARMLDPSFDNQTKDRLNSRDAVRLLERSVQPYVETWFNKNPSQARVVAEVIILAAMARQRASTKVEKRRSSSVVMLPGKLADCESQVPAETEIFLVEGDSAGGSAKQARSKDNQAILPLRGKGLNTWEKTREEAFTNEEVRDISTALGVPLHRRGEDVDLGKLRYGKVCILADADVDGFHIQVLLLTLFYKHFPRLVEAGHIFVSRPPLYRLDAEPVGKKKPMRKFYCMDEQELESSRERLIKEGYKDFQVGRFKGLGEMNPPELWETTLNPDTRRLLKVMLPVDGEEGTDGMFENLMGKSKASWRREWMEAHGSEVEAG
jgi:topoisomerase-4 subunit B